MYVSAVSNKIGVFPQAGNSENKNNQYMSTPNNLPDTFQKSDSVKQNVSFGMFFGLIETKADKLAEWQKYLEIKVMRMKKEAASLGIKIEPTDTHDDIVWKLRWHYLNKALEKYEVKKYPDDEYSSLVERVQMKAHANNPVIDIPDVDDLMR